MNRDIAAVEAWRTAEYFHERFSPGATYVLLSPLIGIAVGTELVFREAVYVPRDSYYVYRFVVADGESEVDLHEPDPRILPFLQDPESFMIPKAIRHIKRSSGDSA